MIIFASIFHQAKVNGQWKRIYKAFTTSASSKTRSKLVNEYDQEIPQSQTADNPVAPRGRAAQPSRDTRKTN